MADSDLSSEHRGSSERLSSRVHPLIVRVTHWVNVVALYIMIASGLRIYDASPIFGDYRFPEWMTIGGWLAGARQWHFFAMWIFAINGTAWLVYNILSRHGRKTTLFRPSDAPDVLPMIEYYLGRRKEHPKSGKYNALQKLAYTSVIFIALLAVLSGIAIYLPVQMQIVTDIFGGYDSARVWHFAAMAGLLLFIPGHLLMVTIAGWPNFVSMIAGRIDSEHDHSLHGKLTPPARLSSEFTRN
jgi:thiosulfate reductase cytochrome b subunit